MFRCTGAFIKLWCKSQLIVWKRITFNNEFWSSFTLAESDVFHSVLSRYKDCLRQNSRFYVSTVAGYAKTKYKVQNLWDSLIHGKREKAAAQVAFMITNSMKQGLTDLGFPLTEITDLKPAYAQYIISNSISHKTWSSSKASLIQKCEEEEEARRKEAMMEAARLQSINHENEEQSEGTSSASSLVLVKQDDDVSEQYSEDGLKPQPLVAVKESASNVDK